MFDHVLKHAKTISSAFVVTSIINVASTIYFARILGPEVFHIFIASTLFREIVGLPFAASYNFPLYHFRKRILYISTRLSALILLLFTLYVSMLAVFLHFNYNLLSNVDKNVVIAMSILFLLNAFGSVSTTILQIRDEYTLISRINIFATIFSILATLVMIMLTQSIYTLVFKEIIYKSLLWIGCLYRIGSLSFFIPNFKINKKVLLTLIYLIYRVWPINFLDFITTRIDKFLINTFYVSPVLSNLQQARYYAELPSTSIMPLTPLLYEKFSDPNYCHKSKQNLIRNISIALIILGLCWGIGLYVFGPVTILFLLGNEWELASELSRGLAFYVTILPYANFLKIIAYYRNQNLHVAFAQFLQVCVFLISFYFVHFYYTVNALPLVFFVSTLAYACSLLIMLRLVKNNAE